MAILGYQTDLGGAGISFCFWKDIETGTVVTFSRSEYKNRTDSYSRTGSQSLVTWTATTPIQAGDVIVIELTSPGIQEATAGTVSGLLYPEEESAIFAHEGSGAITNNNVLFVIQYGYPTFGWVTDKPSTLTGSLTNTLVNSKTQNMQYTGNRTTLTNLEDMITDATDGANFSGDDNNAIFDFDLTDLNITCGLTQVSGFTAVGDGSSSIMLSVADMGDADRILVIAREGSPVTAIPDDDIVYSGNQFLPNADEIAPGQFIVGLSTSGGANFLRVTGLKEWKTYHFKAFGVGDVKWCYNLSAPPEASASPDCSLEPDQPVKRDSEIGDGQITINWSRPPTCYDEFIVVGTENLSVQYNPVGNLSSFTANSMFGMGSEVVSGEYLLYRGTDSTVTVTGLENGKEYNFIIVASRGTRWGTRRALDATPYPVEIPTTGDSIAIAEIHYNPANTQGLDDEFEYISVMNYASNTAYDLTDTYFDQGVNFTFSSGIGKEEIILSPGEYIYLTTDSVSYRTKTDTKFNLDAGSSLSNSGETLRWRAADGSTIDQVTYSQNDHPETNGGGPSLILLDPYKDNSVTNYNWFMDLDDESDFRGRQFLTIWRGTLSDWPFTIENWSNGRPTNSNPALVKTAVITAAPNDLFYAGSSYELLNLIILDGKATFDTRLTITGKLIIENAGELFIESNDSRDNRIEVVDEVRNEGTIHMESGTSFLPNGGYSGSGELHYTRHTTYDVGEFRYSFVGSPVNSFDFSTVPGDFKFTYDEATNTYLDASSLKNMVPGIGYTIANNDSILFTGVPNTGNIVVNIQKTTGPDQGYNLVANPYATAISYDDFMAINRSKASSDITATIYLWDDNDSKNGTSTADFLTINSLGVTGGSGRAGDYNDHIGTAQGFFVVADGESKIPGNPFKGSIRFSESMWSTGNNKDANFFRLKNEISKIKLALRGSNDLYNDLIVAVTPDATEGFDPDYDAHKLKGNDQLQFYSRMADEIFSIQAMAYQDEELTIGLGMDIKNAGNYKIESVESNMGAFDLLIYDSHKNIYHSIINQPYEFSSLTTYDSKRFNLIIREKRITSSFLEEVVITAKLGQGELSISSGEPMSLYSLELISLNGQSLWRKENVVIENGIKSYIIDANVGTICFLKLQHTNGSITTIKLFNQ